MRTKYLILSFCIALFGSCTSNKHEQKSLEQIEEINLSKILNDNNFSDTSILQFKNDKNLTSFIIDHTDTSNWYETDFVESQNFYDNYNKILIYNIDSSAFLDLFSYQILVEKNKQGELAASQGEIDQEVALVDLKRMKRIRLLFNGPSCVYTNAVWLNKNELLVKGKMDVDGSENWKSVITWIHLGSKRIDFFVDKNEKNETSPNLDIQTNFKTKGIKLD